MDDSGIGVARCRDVCTVESNVWGNQNEMVGDVTKLGDIIPIINYGKGKMVSDGGILNVINDKKENSNDKKFITSGDNREEKMIAIRLVGDSVLQKRGRASTENDDGVGPRKKTKLAVDVVVAIAADEVVDSQGGLAVEECVL
ncbi:hypothetical protein Q3G72_021561 [Acer saccharum]|nr:hypothetical protein Q3G72_021561 [Acer saccharum]